jgi:5S rRNA maturation endonuclease (ribonuclease M5)
MTWLDFNDAARLGTDAPHAPPWASQAPDRDEVSRSLTGQLESVLGYLYPNGFADPKGRKFYIGSVKGEAGESLSVELQGERVGLWHDFATGDGGDVFDLWRVARGCASFRETLQDAAEYTGAAINTPRRKPTRRQPKGGEAWGAPSATWRYTDASGKLIATIERFDWIEGDKRKKVFRPWDVAQRKYTHPENRPLYNLPNIMRAPEIVVVEGEKAADALIAQNIDATTAMGGSNAPLEKTDWTPLRGRKVLIWPDNDDAGRAYAEKLKTHLEAQGALAVSVLNVPASKPEKWDAADAEGEDLGAMIRDMRAPAAQPAATFAIDFWDEVDLASIPRVEYVYNRFYAKGYTSVTAAPPKVGKSLLGLIEAVDMASGKGLLTGMPQAPQRVYYYNAEDDIDTIRNRVGAILQHYGLSQDDIRGRLAVHSGIGEDGFYIISGQEGEINEAQFQAMEAKCLEAKIDCIILDPLQDLSRSPETNEVMRLLGARLRRFAAKCQLAIGLIHHTRKMQPGVKASIDDMRGGSALRGTARFNRLLVPMSEDEAAKAGLDDHRAHFQIGDIEGNLAPPSSDYARWYEKISVVAPNSESVGVIVPWQWPDAFDGIDPQIAEKVRKAVMAADPRPKENAQASSWAGHIVGPILGIDSTEKAGQARLKSIIRTWIKSDVLAVERIWSTRDGRDVPFVVAGSNNPTEGDQ